MRNWAAAFTVLLAVASHLVTGPVPGSLLHQLVVIGLSWLVLAWATWHLKSVVFLVPTTLVLGVLTVLDIVLTNRSDGSTSGLGYLAGALLALPVVLVLFIEKFLLRHHKHRQT